MGFQDDKRREARWNFLCREFKNADIDTRNPGFYDHPHFLQKERNDPSFLENYAEWVELCPRNMEYDDMARTVVPKVANLVFKSFTESSFQGSCVAGAGMISRILDRLGVWSYAVAGSVILEVESKDILRGFYINDFKDFEGAMLGHSWVVAPPFKVVDATIRLQRWGDSDAIIDHVPDVIVTECGVRHKPTVADIVSAELRMHFARRNGYMDEKLHFKMNEFYETTSKKFKAWKVTERDLTAKYIPVAIRQTDVPLEQINTDGNIGVRGDIMWNDIIRPAFQL